MIQEGNTVFREGHYAHASLLKMEASGDQIQVTLLMLHAQDLLMRAANFKILAVELIDLFEMLHKHGNAN